jgi:glycosyltransferase involved in cell wall biosynthesis
MNSRSLRIVYACPFFEPALNFGGPVTQLSTMCRALAARGHRVRVVTTDVGTPSDLERDRWLKRDGYQVFYAKSSRLGRFPPYYNTGVREALEQALGDADVLDLQSNFTHLNHVARGVAARRRVPFVVTPRDALSPVCLRYRSWEKQVFLRLWERSLLTDATAIHALHKTEKEEIARQAATGHKTWIISNACELAGRTHWPAGEAFRRTFGIAPGAPLVLFMSRLHPRKGLDLLCRAFHTVNSRVPQAVLALAGSDEGGLHDVRREASGLLASGAIRVVGPLAGELKLSALVAADVFTLTSRSEGIPNSVLEALSSGTPCVITEACHVPEVRSRGAGRVTSLSPSEIAAALVELLQAPAALAQMGKNAAAYAAEAHRPERIAGELEALYEHCAGTAGHG